MGLKFRVIARIDIRRDKAIQRCRFEGAKALEWSPLTLARWYEDEGADELLINDCYASIYHRSQLYHITDEIATAVMIPVTICGGLGSIEDVARAFTAGADKVAINTALHETHNLIEDIAVRWGSQALSLQLDVRDDFVTSRGGRQQEMIGPRMWARVAETRGVGEVMFTCIDQDGTLEGPDRTFYRYTEDLKVPVIYAGGIRYGIDVAEIAKYCQGVVVNRALHEKVTTVGSIKSVLKDHGVEVRTC